MDFKTVFVFTDKIPAIVNDDLYSLILAIVGFFFVISAKSLRKEWALKSVRLLGFTVTITLVVFSVLFGLRDYQKYREFAEVYNQAQYQVVEGVVEILPVSDRARNKHDQIRIANMEFTIDYYYHTFGYSQIIVQGGVLRAGTHVRVYYYQGEILRIDLRSSKDTNGVQSVFGKLFKSRAAQHGLQATRCAALRVRLKPTVGRHSGQNARSGRGAIPAIVQSRTSE